MKFVLACHGTRGDTEPGVAVGRELLRRGHDVRMAVAPDLVAFVESAGLATVAYGPESRRWQAVHLEFLTLFRTLWRIQDLIRVGREDWKLFTQCWKEVATTLTSLAEGADLIITTLLGAPPAANVAEYYDIPLTVLHYFPHVPARALSRLLPFLPTWLIRFGITMSAWLDWRVVKKLEDAQRHELGLPKATVPTSRRLAERGLVEIQAYDEVCFPELEAEWAKRDVLRPFVGALTMELATDADEVVASWIAAGTPPIYFGFGSMPVKSAADTIAMISTACAQLGERALVCSGGTDFSQVPHLDHIKVVGPVNHAATFPACRAVVHHGGAGTTAAGLRAGVPTLILSMWPEQSLWGSRVERLKVGTARRFWSTTAESLVADLRTILTPQYVTRAREIATQMTKPAESVAAAADLMESLARSRRVG